MARAGPSAWKGNKKNEEEKNQILSQNIASGCLEGRAPEHVIISEKENPQD
jgi:hypothetical protein